VHTISDALTEYVSDTRGAVDGFYFDGGAVVADRRDRPVAKAKAASKMYVDNHDAYDRAAELG
jgi:hypothetical protein